MTKRDYYEVLGVSRAADDAQIKSSYRKLALKYHPDRNPGDAAAEEQFKEAAEAYAVLADPQKRGRYDQFGHAGVSGASGRPDVDPTIFADFGDVFGGGFGDLFGSATSSGADAEADLPVARTCATTCRSRLQDAATGMESTLQIPRLEECSRCGGAKAEPGTSAETCSQCDGHGQVRYQQGFLTVARTCGRCRGSGNVVTQPLH